MKQILLLDGEGVQVVCMARELNKLGYELSALNINHQTFILNLKLSRSFSIDIFRNISMI